MVANINFFFVFLPFFVMVPDLMFKMGYFTHLEIINDI